VSNICVIKVLNVSSEEFKVNWKFHVVAELGSNLTSWMKWIMKLILAICYNLCGHCCPQRGSQEWSNHASKRRLNL